MLKIVHSRDASKRPVPGADGTGPKQQNGQHARWTRYAITMLLLLALAATGTMAYSARQQWWQLISHTGKG
jgi:hypothetical protein